MKLKEPGIFKLKQYKRYYPHQEHASHILGGVNIGEYATIGVGFVVASDFKSHSIVVGNTVKIIND